MAGERIASDFARFNFGLQNQQNVGTLTWMIQIRQWAIHMVKSKRPVVAYYNVEGESTKKQTNEWQTSRRR